MCCNESAAPPAKQFEHDLWMQPRDSSSGFGRTLASVGRTHAVSATSQGLVLMLLDPASVEEHTSALQARVSAIPVTCSGGGAADIQLASSAAWFVAHVCGFLYAFSASLPTSLLQRELNSSKHTMALAVQGDHLYVLSSSGTGNAVLVAMPPHRTLLSSHFLLPVPSPVYFKI